MISEKGLIQKKINCRLAAMKGEKKGKRRPAPQKNEERERKTGKKEMVETERATPRQAIDF